jgi:hypothetical protein
MSRSLQFVLQAEVPTVKSRARGEEYIRDIRRHELRDAAMQAATERKRAKASKRDVITWKVQTLEPIAPFELGDGTRFLSPVNIFAVNEMSRPFLAADFDGLSQEGVRGTLISVRFHRKDLHDASDVVHHHELNKPNQVVTKKRTDEFAAI